MQLSFTQPLEQVALDEAALVALCREVARLDETLLVHLLPYLPFRTAKQRLPAAAFGALAWHMKTGEDLAADLDEAMEAWAIARRHGNRRECLRAQRLVAALLRIAGRPEGDLLWRLAV